MPSKPARRKEPLPAPATDVTPSGWVVEYLNEAVVEEATAWPDKLRGNLSRIIDRIEAVGLTNIPSEYRKHMRGKIWELRPDAEGIEGRAFYVTVTGKRVVIVLCKIKKRKKTPPEWLNIAEDRAKSIDRGEDE